MRILEIILKAQQGAFAHLLPRPHENERLGRIHVIKYGRGKRVVLDMWRDGSLSPSKVRSIAADMTQYDNVILVADRVVSIRGETCSAVDQVITTEFKLILERASNRTAHVQTLRYVEEPVKRHNEEF